MPSLLGTGGRIWTPISIKIRHLMDLMNRPPASRFTFSHDKATSPLEHDVSQSAKMVTTCPWPKTTIQKTYSIPSFNRENDDLSVPYGNLPSSKIRLALNFINIGDNNRQQTSQFMQIQQPVVGLVTIIAHPSLRLSICFVFRFPVHRAQVSCQIFFCILKVL